MVHLTSLHRISAKVAFVGPQRSGKSENLTQIVESGRCGVDCNVIGSVLRMHVADRMMRLDNDEIIEVRLPDVDVDDDVFGYEMAALSLGKIGTESLHVSLYALPGHADAHEHIDRLWRGIDVMVFVADSRRSALDENVRAWRRARENPWHDASTALVLQLNRRDDPDAAPPEEIIHALEWGGGSIHEAVASEGIGVAETMRDVFRAIRHRAERTLAQATA
jgi:signal recognition particle receptor subunit beta